MSKLKLYCYVNYNYENCYTKYIWAKSVKKATKQFLDLKSIKGDDTKKNSGRIIHRSKSKIQIIYPAKIDKNDDTFDIIFEVKPKNLKKFGGFREGPP